MGFPALQKYLEQAGSGGFADGDRSRDADDEGHVVRFGTEEC